MRNTLFFCALLLFTGLVVTQSCETRKKTPVIGLLMDQFNVERWAKDTTYFIEAVNQLGGKVICMSANGDAQKQYDQAKMLMDNKVKVIVILPVDAKKAADIVGMIKKEKSMSVISYDRLIQNALIDYYVSFDNVKVGEMQAEYIKNRMQKGNIALIGGPVSDQNSFYLNYGQVSVLQPYIERGDLKIVFDKMVNAWTFDEGYRLAKECLQNNKVDAIIAGNDLLARGAIKALREKQLDGKVLVAGQDADTQACENIVSGLQAMSVYKPIRDIATNAAKMAVDLANGKEITNATFTVNNGFMLVPSVLIKPMVVNKGNIGMEINPEKPKL
jgi:D-xylose transport system substrate-binding protein